MKRLSKVLALILSVIMIITIIPFSAISANTDKKVKLNTETEKIDVSQLKVVSEIKEKRDAFTKVYQLEDGTFYEVKSALPVHFKQNGNWVEVKKSSLPTTAGKINAQVKELSRSIQTRSLNSNADLEDTDEYFNGMFIDSTLSDEFNYDSMDALLSDPDLIDLTKINPEILLLVSDDNDRTQANNEQTISYQYQLGLELDDEDAIGNIYLYENNKDMTDDDLWGFDNFFYIRNESNHAHLLDIVPVDDDGDYSFDATDLYNRWKKSIADDYGVAFETTGDCYTTVTSFSATRRYRVINAFNSTSTYHTVDMGRAGTLYIDDFTNTPTLKREEIALMGNLAPVQINRYYDFGRQITSNNLYGDYGVVNYEARLSRVATDSNKSIYFWNAINGQSVKFVVPSNSTTASDIDGLGYTITNISGENYASATITTPENSVAEFNSSGQMKKITDTYGDAITVSYTSGRITYIQDGLARRYYFTYSSPTYTYGNSSFSMRTLKSITIKHKVGVTYRTLVVNNISMIYEFEYVGIGTNNVGLSSVTYPDEEVVEYEYNNGLLYKITNIDGRCLTLNYSGNMTSYSCQEPDLEDSVQLYEITGSSSQVNQAPAVTGYIEEVPNTDGNPNDPNYQAFLTVSSLTIDRHNSYQRKFIDNSNNTEIIQYDSELRPVTYQKNNGQIYSYHYSANGLSDSITRFTGFSSADNLLLNSAFNGVTNWNASDTDAISAAVVSINNGNDENVIRVNGIDTDDCFAYQVISSNNIAANTIIAIEGKGIANFPVTNSNNFYGIEVYSCTNTNGANEQLLYQLPFDNTVYYEQQHRIGAFVLSQTTPYLKVKLMFSHQENWALLDDVMLYADDGTHVITEQVNGSSTNSFFDSNDVVSYNNKGLVESITRNNTVEKTTKVFEYDNNSFLSETRINNIQTTYVYDNITGMLTSKADSFGSTTYEYSPMGLLKKVSAAVSNLTDQNTAINANYTYERDRIATISNNGQTYSFDYNSFGRIKSVSVKENGATSDNTLVNYSYVGKGSNLEEIRYANGDKIQYSYINGNIAQISFLDAKNCPKVAYKYFYNNGDIDKVVDSISNLVISYNATGYSIMPRIGDTDNGDTNNIIYSVNNQSNGSRTGKLFSINYEESSAVSASSNNSLSTSNTLDLTFTNSSQNVFLDSFEGTSVTDYFNREKSTSFESSCEDTEGMIVGGEEISYSNTTNYLDYSLGNEVFTSNYPSNNIVSVESSNFDDSKNFASYYEYDTAGRIKKVFYSNATSEDDLLTNKTLAFYYEYDEIGQITLCVDVLNQILTKISYDSNGNITSKLHYKNDSFTFNSSNCTYTLNSSATEKLFSYDSLGRLTGFDGNSISYDTAGNPLDYYNYDSTSSSNDYYKLKWEYGYLTIADKISGTVTINGKIFPEAVERYRYTYNPDGKMTKKTVYSTCVDYSNSTSEEVVYTETFKSSFDYIWDKDKNIGFKYSFVKNNQTYSVDCQYVYSGDEVLGIVTHSNVNSFNLISDEQIYDNTEILLNNIFWFIKDGTGNIVSIYTPRNDFSLDLFRDNNGVYSGFGASGVMIEDMHTYIENHNNGYFDLLTAIATVMAQADVMRIAPTEFKGFMVDSDTGICYRAGRYYSTSLGRYINYGDLRNMQKDTSQLLNSNVFAFCSNDTMNNSVAADFAVKPFVEKAYDVNIANNWYKYFKQH